MSPGTARVRFMKTSLYPQSETTMIGELGVSCRGARALHADLAISFFKNGNAPASSSTPPALVPLIITSLRVTCRRRRRRRRYSEPSIERKAHLHDRWGGWRTRDPSVATTRFYDLLFHAESLALVRCYFDFLWNCLDEALGIAICLFEVCVFLPP